MKLLKPWLGVALCILYSIKTYSQTVSEDIVFIIVEEMPKFPKGKAALDTLLNAKVEARDGHQGFVTIQFIVNRTDCKLKDITLLDSIENAIGLNRSVKRAFEEMAYWIPGKQNGRYVNVQLKIKITVNSTNQLLIKDPLELALEGLKKSNPGVVWTGPKSATFFYNEGTTKLKEGDYGSASVKFTKCLDINPKDVDALYNRGVANFKTQDIDGACKDWHAIQQMGKPDADKLIKQYCNQ